MLLKRCCEISHYEHPTCVGVFVVAFTDNKDEFSPHSNFLNANGESRISCETSGFGSQVSIQEKEIHTTSAEGIISDKYLCIFMFPHV